MTAEVADREPDHRWVLGVWIIVAVFAAVTVVRSHELGIPIRDPGGTLFRNRIAGSLGLFVTLSIVDACLRTGRRGWTVRRTVTTLRGRWTRQRLALAAAALVAYQIVYLCYRNLKSWDAFNSVRDAMLLDWDRWLFFGHSPAVLLHDLLGERVAAYVLMAIYESFSALVAVSFVAALVFAHRVRDGYVFVASAMWVWILGVGSYYLIPSIGPFNSAAGEFAGLPNTLVQDTQVKFMAERAHMLAHPEAADAFAQISAFASLHVAVTSVILLMAWYYRLRRTTWVMSAFVVGTVLATIYLGWHFAVDDFAGVVIAVLAVTLGRLTIYPRGGTRISTGFFRQPAATPGASTPAGTGHG